VLASNVPVKVIVALLAPEHNVVALELVAVTTGVTFTVGNVAVLLLLIVVLPPHGGVMPVTVSVLLLLADVNNNVLNVKVVPLASEVPLTGVSTVPLILYAIV
jgi:hypothetical protein